MMPSRDFLVRQAVLNAAQDYWPATVRYHGMAYALDSLSHGGISNLFQTAINREFRKLTERNWGPLA